MVVAPSGVYDARHERGYLSVPLYPKSVLLGHETDEDTGVTQDLRDTPETTAGLQVAAGLRIPLRTSGQERGSIHVGIGGTSMTDGDEDIGFSGAGLGLSLLL